MKPLKLKMQAFGSYGKETLIDFEKVNQNLFLVTGDTGAGKTTIFDAIVFALYGEASSSSNKKDGVVLQSQYVDFSCEPFVELTFEDKEEIYTVRRVPRHLKTVTRGAGKGKQREITGSVSLIMPDGTEYPSKETDRKLQEITGLTKGQFMQVAMIAQGEFMDLLRAKSDDKKVIFRKLFNTEMYQKIVEELGQRKKAKEKDIAIIKTECRTEAARVRILPEYEHAQNFQAQKDLLMDGQTAEIGKFLEELREFCSWLKAKTRQAEKDYQEAGEIRDKRKEILTKTESCAVSFRDAEKNFQSLKADLEQIKKELPGLQAASEEAAAKEKESRKLLDQQLENFSSIQQKVQKALEIFERLKELQKAVNNGKTASKNAEAKRKKAEEQLQVFEQQEKGWRQRREELSDTESRIQNWKTEAGNAKAAGEQAGELQSQKNQLEELIKQGSEAKKAYINAQEKYQKEREKYEHLRQEFLNAQAGILARDLKPGIPCPVCGSLEHPHPNINSKDGEHVDISQELLEKLSANVDKLSENQQKAAEKAKSVQTEFSVKEETWRKSFHKLCLFVAEIYPEAVNCQSLDEIKIPLKKWEKNLLEEREKIQKDYTELKKIQKDLKEAESKKELLKKQLESCREEETATVKNLTTAETALRNFRESSEYATEKEATDTLQKAKEHKKQQEVLHQKDSDAAVKTRTAREQAEILEERYEKELPEKEQLWKKRKEEYETLLDQASGSYNREEIREQQREAVVNAEQKLKEAEEVRDRYRNALRDDQEVYDSLSTKRENRQKIIEEHTRLNILYSLAAGNVSGARMDLETYVQRYYLERVLYAANRRFQEMSAGQFELRMYDLEKAGEGRNKGLDLMVYSTVTGKEREVRTLSGGESFMAALSLALGMADQIQESSAAVNLDMMFIDEGFGSLDEHSRNQAVRVLLEMAEGSRLIGIISHVTELKQEIEDQLLVTKNEEGSHVKWQIS